MARSPIPDMIERFHEMTPEERSCFLDLVDPQPEPEAPKQKRTRKKKAEAPAAQKKGLPASNGAAGFKARCVFAAPDEDICDRFEDNLIHDPNGGYGGYHPFQSAAPVAARRSSRKSASTSSTPSSEGEAANAMSASSGGD